VEDIKNFFRDRKKFLNVMTLLVIALAIPLGVNLLKNSQFFFSKARGV
jgi:hypothetical protein